MKTPAKQSMGDNLSKMYCVVIAKVLSLLPLWHGNFINADLFYADIYDVP